MQYSQIPAALTKAFAASGDKNAIPTDANSSTLANGLAAFSSGFPPVTSLPASAGGQNPVREDFNGVLGMLTTIHQWQMTGAARKYESAFSTAIGGYPNFAVLVKASGSGFWISTADNNTTDPDSVGSANWKDLSAFLTGSFIDQLPTGTADAMVASITLPTLDASFAGVPVFVRAIGSNTSTTPTYGGKTIVKGNNLALVAGDIVSWMELQYDATWDKLVLLNPANGVNSVSVKQLQSITATVAANAITLGLDPTSLDFRSSDLTNGVPNTRAVAAALSLVIPAGATLGTVSGQESRLVLLAIDNAGTVELAVVNLAGGNNLDETTLISTTAISAGADANNVIYSTTSRANVPFRVVGFVAITEAAAGTWATAPTTIQGQGGQALAAMQSLGFGQTWQNVLGSRVLGTTYYNTTPRPIYVSTSCDFSTSGATFQFTLNGLSTGNLIYNNQRGGAFFIVPPGCSYSMTGTTTLTSWNELR